LNNLSKVYCSYMWRR